MTITITRKVCFWVMLQYEIDEKDLLPREQLEQIQYKK